MPQVHREHRESAAEINALAVPARETVNSEGVAKVVWAGTNASTGWLQATIAIQLPERLARCHHWEATETRADE
jgi:hypothetical protein